MCISTSTYPVLNRVVVWYNYGIPEATRSVKDTLLTRHPNHLTIRLNPYLYGMYNPWAYHYKIKKDAALKKKQSQLTATV